ncbi:hypothetical protein FQA39_LY14961 [Lamprigera yunnana]|nr:hypothetical protein FQA39_LY14961 [Lamprigera yunnana]
MLQLKWFLVIPYVFLVVQSATIYSKPFDIPVKVVYSDVTSYQTFAPSHDGRRNLHEKVQIPLKEYRQLKEDDHKNVNSLRNLDAKVQLSSEDLLEIEKHLPKIAEDVAIYRSSLQENIEKENEKNDIVSESLPSSSVAPEASTEKVEVSSLPSNEENIPDIILLIQIAQSIVTEGLKDIKEDINKYSSNSSRPLINEAQWNNLNKTISDFFVALLHRRFVKVNKDNVLQEIIVGVKGATNNYLKDLRGANETQSQVPPTSGLGQNIIDFISNGFQRVTSGLSNMLTRNSTMSTVLGEGASTTTIRPFQNLLNQIANLNPFNRPSSSSAPPSEGGTTKTQGQAINNLNPIGQQPTPALGSQGDAATTKTPLQVLQESIGQVGQAIGNLNPFTTPPTAALESQSDVQTTKSPFQLIQESIGQVGQAIGNLNPFNQQTTIAPGAQGDTLTTRGPLQALQESFGQVGQAISNLNPFNQQTAATTGAQSDTQTTKNPLQVFQESIGQAINNLNPFNQLTTVNSASSGNDQTTKTPFQAFQESLGQVGQAISNLNPFNQQTTSSPSGPIQNVISQVQQGVSSNVPSLVGNTSDIIQSIASQGQEIINNQNVSLPSGSIGEVVQSIASQGQEIINNQNVSLPSGGIGEAVQAIASQGQEIIDNQNVNAIINAVTTLAPISRSRQEDSVTTVNENIQNLQKIKTEPKSDKAEVIQDSVADQNGLRVGDVIVRINNDCVVNSTHLEVQDIIAEAGEDLIFGIRRDYYTDEDEEDENNNLEVSSILGSTIEESSQKVETYNQRSLSNLTDELIADAIIGEIEVLPNQNVLGVNFSKIDLSQSTILKTIEDHKAEENVKLNERRWSAFLQKPQRPVLKPKSKNVEPKKAPPYQVIIKKQKRKNLIVNETEPSDIIPETAIQQNSECEEDEVETNSVNEYSGNEECDDEAGVISEEIHTNDEIEFVNTNDNDVENVETNDVEKPLTIDEQLLQVQMQLKALSQLPSTIQDTLESVTKQLTSILNTTQHCTDEDYQSQSAHDNKDENLEETRNEDDAQADDDRTERFSVESESDFSQRESNIDNEDDTQVELLSESEEEEDKEQPEPELNAVEVEQLKLEAEKDIQKTRAKYHQRRLEQRPTYPLAPIQRPIILPGGRRWSQPDDAVPIFRKKSSMSDEKIIQTLDNYSETIVGHVKGINFLKYQPPPKNLEYLQKSEVYKLIHNMDAPARGIATRPETIASEQDYYTKFNTLDICKAGRENRKFNGLSCVEFTTTYYALPKYMRNVTVTIVQFVGATVAGTKSVDFIPRYLEYKKMYGDVVKLYIGPDPSMLMINDYKFIEYVLKSVKILDKALEYRYLFKWLGNGLVTSNGNQTWKKHRKLIAPSFNTMIIEEFFETFESNSLLLVNKLRKEIGKPSFNIYKYMSLCSLDIICESSMGISVNAQNSVHSDYVAAVKVMCALIIERGFSLLRYDCFYIFSSLYQKEKQAVRVLQQRTDNVVKNRNRKYVLKTESEKGTNKKRRPTFLDLLLRYNQNNDLTEDEMKDEVNTFMFAGHDTTTSALSFTLYCLSNNPEVQSKVVQEMDEILGDDMQRSLTLSNFQLMKYLDAVIKESLRLYPPVPFIGRVVSEEFEFDGKLIPKGISLLLNIYGIHHNPNFYPDPESFKPERFMDETDNTRPKYTFLPFSSGMRNCIGQKFAMLELKYILCTLLRHYEFLASIPKHEVLLATETILVSHNGIGVRIVERKRCE